MGKTRPDTRPIPVADGWAGAEMHVFPTFRLVFTDRPTNRRTDGRTDKASYRVACPRLKRSEKLTRVKEKEFTVHKTWEKINGLHSVLGVQATKHGYEKVTNRKKVGAKL